jgi:glycerol-3-phosphate dehydrogenase (NAD(P)+)
MSGYSVGVIGAGAWGTALASVAAGVQGACIIWTRNQGVAKAINESHSNPDYLPGTLLPSTVHATTDMTDVMSCDMLLVVTPAQHLRSVLMAMPECNATLVLCCKGIEAGTQKLMVDVASEIRPQNPIAILSGPTFANEVAAGLPTAITLACEQQSLGERISQAIAAPHFRPYWTDDVIGAEIGGAVKNVLAIACGVVDGAQLGLNARSALIARGFAEMQRFGLAKGARAETLSGLSGLGDLVLTCNSEKSRNFALGRGIGQGRVPSELLENRTTVAEGAATAPVLLQSAQAMGVDMPIVAAVCALLSGSVTVQEAMQRLLTRPLKAEG